MGTRTRTAVYTTLATIAMFTAGCGDDDTGNNPTGPSAVEIVLATFSSSGSASGPDEPSLPYAMIIQIGVDDKVLDSYAELPDPIVFSDRTFEDDTNFIARPFETPDFGILAMRLTDGRDTSAYVAMHAVDGGGSSSSGPESGIFTYAPGLSLVGPDLAGYTVTGLQVELDIEVTENAGFWTQAYTCTLSILGH
jgi:hypothetical protein